MLPLILSLISLRVLRDLRFYQETANHVALEKIQLAQQLQRIAAIYARRADDEIEFLMERGDKGVFEDFFRSEQDPHAHRRQPRPAPPQPVKAPKPRPQKAHVHDSSSEEEESAEASMSDDTDDDRRPPKSRRQTGMRQAAVQAQANIAASAAVAAAAATPIASTPVAATAQPQQPTAQATAQSTDSNGSEEYNCVCGVPNRSDQWIGCDAETCAVGWYHLVCVGLKEAPEESWICQRCKEATARKK